MTENEAIARIKYRIETATDIVGKSVDGKAYEDMEIAIKALEEVQQYRSIGTVEECQDLAKEHPKAHDIGAVIDAVRYDFHGFRKETREILLEGKRKDNGEWIEGFLFYQKMDGNSVLCIGTEPLLANDFSEISGDGVDWCEIIPGTICRHTGLNDKNGRKIFGWNICTLFDNSYYANLTGVVKFGEYNQDGSGGEYPPTPVIGFYVEIVKWEYLESSTFKDEEYPKWCRTISLLEAMDEKTYANFEVIGNVFDNPELIGL